MFLVNTAHGSGSSLSGSRSLFGGPVGIGTVKVVFSGTGGEKTSFQFWMLVHSGSVEEAQVSIMKDQGFVLRVEGDSKDEEAKND